MLTLVRRTHAHPCTLSEKAAPRRDVAVCARVAGVDIPNNKRVEVALTYVYGVGPTKAKDILAVTGVENKRVRELSEDELTLLRNELADTDKHMLEGDLRRVRLGNVKRLIDTQPALPRPEDQDQRQAAPGQEGRYRGQEEGAHRPLIAERARE